MQVSWPTGRRPFIASMKFRGNPRDAVEIGNAAGKMRLKEKREIL